jgi:ribosomal protein S14
MKSHYLKDLKKRFFVKRLEYTKLVCNFLIYSNFISNLDRYKIFFNFYFSKKIKKNFELNNHCILTKNTKAVNRFSSLTRSNFKNLISCGFLNGITKYS